MTKFDLAFITFLSTLSPDKSTTEAYEFGRSRSYWQIVTATSPRPGSRIQNLILNFVGVVLLGISAYLLYLTGVSVYTLLSIGLAACDEGRGGPGAHR